MVGETEAHSVECPECGGTPGQGLLDEDRDIALESLRAVPRVGRSVVQEPRFVSAFCATIKGRPGTGHSSQEGVRKMNRSQNEQIQEAYWEHESKRWARARDAGDDSPAARLCGIRLESYKSGIEYAAFCYTQTDDIPDLRKAMSDYKAAKIALLAAVGYPQWLIDASVAEDFNGI